MWCKFDRTRSDVVAEFTTDSAASPEKEIFVYLQQTWSNRQLRFIACGWKTGSDAVSQSMNTSSLWYLRDAKSICWFSRHQRHWASKWPKLHTLLPSESLVVQRLCPANPPMKCLKSEALALLSVVFRPAPWLKVESEGSVEWYPI